MACVVVSNKVELVDRKYADAFFNPCKIRVDAYDPWGAMILHAWYDDGYSRHSQYDEQKPNEVKWLHPKKLVGLVSIMSMGHCSGFDAALTGRKSIVVRYFDMESFDAD